MMMKKLSIVTRIDSLLRYTVFVWVNAVIFIAKVLYSIANGFPGEKFEDWSIASNIAKHGVYSEFLHLGSTAYKLPVYPLFLSFFIKCFPAFSKEMVVLVQHALFSVFPFLFVAILRLFDREKEGFLAGYIFLFSPAYFFYSNVIEATNIFILIFAGWLYFYAKIFQGAMSLRTLGMLGVFTGLLSLTQVVAVPFMILLLGYLFFTKRLSVRQSFTVAMVSLVVYSPWVVRNAVVFEAFIPTKTPVWQNVYLSFTDSDVNLWKSVKIISSEHEKYTSRLRTKVDEFTMEHIYREEVERVLQGREEIYWEKGMQNAFLLWYVPARYVEDSSISILLGRKLYVCVLHIGVLCALVYYAFRRRLLFWGYAFLCIGFTVPYMIGHAANMRFKLDFEWLLYILVALALPELKNAVARWRERLSEYGETV